MNTTTVPILEGFRYEARSITYAISEIQAGRENSKYADGELGLTVHTERLFNLLAYFGNREIVRGGINRREEEQRLINFELGYLSGDAEALNKMFEEAQKISAYPHQYIDLKRVNGDLYDIMTGEFSS